MRTVATLAVACAVSLAEASFDGGHSVIDEAIRTLGADPIKTLQFTASDATFSVGQNFTPTDPWSQSYGQALHRPHRLRR